MTDVVAAGRRVPGWVVTAAVAALSLAVLVQAVSTGLDLIEGVLTPFPSDYGEGIVWQQMLLIPGPAMYDGSTRLPFIVFHYPPLYHLVVRALMSFVPSALEAGRVVSALSTVLFVPSLMAIILAGTEGERRWRTVVLAAGCAGLVLGLHAVREWGGLMRVDMLGVSLALAGLAVGMRADGRFVGMVVALLLCLAAVFTKQTLVSAGVSVCVMGVWRRPRPAIGATLVALAVGVGVVLWLQALTGGGFLENIVGRNINRLTPERALLVLGVERQSLPFMVMMAAGAWGIGRTLGPSLGEWPGWGGLRAIRTAPRAVAARTMLLLYFGLCTLSLSTLLKVGGNVNYLVEFLCAGCAVLGVALIQLSRVEGLRSRLVAAVLVVAVVVAMLPTRPLGGLWPRPPVDGSVIADRDMLVGRIAAAGRPVWSDNMWLLLTAGKSVFVEPAIVTELASVGLWDETPLVEMIRRRGFAFFLTDDDIAGSSERRTAAVDAAMRAAYPRVRGPFHGVLLHEEAEAAPP